MTMLLNVGFWPHFDESRSFDESRRNLWIVWRCSFLFCEFCSCCLSFRLSVCLSFCSVCLFVILCFTFLSFCLSVSLYLSVFCFRFPLKCKSDFIVAFALIIIIMYIYHALINALSAHMIHINLNMIFYTHVEHSPTKNNLHKVLYKTKNKNALQKRTTNTHTLTVAETRYWY